MTERDHARQVVAAQNAGIFYPDSEISLKGYRKRTPRKLLEGNDLGPPQAYVVFTHGGAGSPSENVFNLRRIGAERAAKIGERLIASGTMSTLDTAVEMVALMEDDVNLIAGAGSGPNEDGIYEFDAFTMTPATQDRYLGITTAVGTVKHPVHVARLVYESPKSYIRSGNGATKFARKHLPFYTRKQMEELYHQGIESREGIYTPSSDTVGAIVAAKWNNEWQMAIAGSTGGMPDKERGRVGDCGTPGAGFYVVKNGPHFSSLQEIAGALLSGLGEASMHTMPASTWTKQFMWTSTARTSTSAFVDEITRTSVKGKPGWGAMAGLAILEGGESSIRPGTKVIINTASSSPWFPVAVYTNLSSVSMAQESLIPNNGGPAKVEKKIIPVYSSLASATK